MTFLSPIPTLYSYREGPGPRVQGHIVPAQLPHFLGGRARRQMLTDKVSEWFPLVLTTGKKRRPCYIQSLPLTQKLFYQRSNFFPELLESLSIQIKDA